jgi:hypothetical protein
MWGLQWKIVPGSKGTLFITQRQSKDILCF